MKSKIGIKLLASYIVLPIITLIIVGSLLNPLFKNYLVETKKRELLNQTNEMVLITEGFLQRKTDAKSFYQIVDGIGRFNHNQFIIVDDQGLLIANSQVSLPRGKKAPMMGNRLILFSEKIEKQVLSGETVIIEGISPYLNTSLITVAKPIITKNSDSQPQVSGAVFTFAPVRIVTDPLQKAYYYLGISSLIAIFLAAGIAYYFTRIISRPLKDMNKAALAMAKGNYKTTVEKISEDELGELATSLNYLANQLDLNISALQQEKGKLESIVLSINEGIIAVDKDGIIILVNPMIEKLFMTTTKNILDKDLSEFSLPHELTNSFKEALTSGELTSNTLKWVHNTYKIVVSPIKKEDGTLMGAVGILQDISEIEKLEQLRRDFIANISHELRAPVTVIRGYTDCLLDGVIENPPEYYHKIIKSETLRLERLVQEFMDLSLLQSGKVELYMEEVNISQLLSETVNKLMWKAKAKDIHLSANVNDQNDLIVFCDGGRIEQLLIILLDNALKFTPSGGTVEVSLQESGDKVLLTVKDSGIGIPKKDVPYIWDRFYKVDKSRSRASENGTGLGLFIAKQIADLHQAKLTVESSLEQGSTFSLELKK